MLRNAIEHRTELEANEGLATPELSEEDAAQLFLTLVH